MKEKWVWLPRALGSQAVRKSSQHHQKPVRKQWSTPPIFLTMDKEKKIQKSANEERQDRKKSQT